MTKELNPAYNPKDVEEKIYRLWEESGYFDPDKLPGKHRKKFSVMMAPPNITGSLHMGHALENVSVDILVRAKRMQGFKTLWLPGIDHACIAAQNVVEKELRKQNIRRQDLGREKFVEKIWEWKEKYGGLIFDQFKKLGVSPEWSRTRFTLDPGYVKAVQAAFINYYEKGWIYRGERVINWCPKCETGISDLEIEYREENGKIYHIKYPLTDKSGFITVATTRPETMLGDAAVAVHPSDIRYKKFIGQNVILPLINRKIPVIGDKRVEPEFGTGAVKVTPSHSIIDSEIGQEHNLDFFKIIDEKGIMLPSANENYAGLKIAQCRTKVIEDLEKQGLIEKTEDYEYNIGLCYRCGSVIENLPSMQWFLKMEKLAEIAIKAVKSGKIKFHPERWSKIYLEWLKNVRDWNISRQIWWGHKIPIEGESDVLDTWFSSALWPFAVFNKKNDLKNFYPTDAMVTARDIINLWVARMVFSGLEFMKKPPFKDVIIHATILTKEGRRMSKSLGTGLDPMDFVERYGADATRFALIWQSMKTQDVHWSEEALVAGRKFLNKTWNAARFVLEPIEPSSEALVNDGYKIKSKTVADKEMLKNLRDIIKKTNKNIDNFEFGQALHELYDFFWHDFCDKYIESSKLQMSDNKLKDNTQKILLYVLAVSLK